MAWWSHSQRQLLLNRAHKSAVAFLVVVTFASGGSLFYQAYLSVKSRKGEQKALSEVQRTEH